MDLDVGFALGLLQEILDNNNKNLEQAHLLPNQALDIRLDNHMIESSMRKIREAFNK